MHEQDFLQSLGLLTLGYALHLKTRKRATLQQTLTFVQLVKTERESQVEYTINEEPSYGNATARLSSEQHESTL